MLLNGVTERVEVTCGEAEAFAVEKTDMVLANLHLQVIDALVRREAFLLSRWIVLSGLFHEQVNGIMASLEQWQPRVHDRMIESRWVTLVLRKNTS